MGGVCRLGEQVGAGTTEDMSAGIDAPAAKLLLVREAVNTRDKGDVERLRRPTERRGDKEAETYQRGNGVSRQADHWGVVKSSDALRTAGLLVHMAEPAIEYLADYFEFPGGDSA